MNLLYPGRSYVLKHLLSRYYASDDSAEIELGIAAVKALDVSPVFGHKTNEPTDFRLARSALLGGPDGSRTRDLWLDRPVC